MISNRYLPYQDTKAVGAPDFYFAINSTFRFIKNEFGMEGLVEYWRGLGEEYYQPVTKLWKEQGLPAVAGYWKEFFEHEPEAEVEIESDCDRVTLNIAKCPAIAHLRKHGRLIEPVFCQHCHYVSQAMAEPAGLEVRVRGGNGVCSQEFSRTGAVGSPLDLNEISCCS